MMQVVDRRELAGENLVAAIEVAQIRAAEPVRARVTRATWFDRARVARVFRVADAQGAAAREQEAVARIAGRHHAVEQIHPAAYRGDDVLRAAHAHEVAWPLARQQGIEHVEHRIALGLGLADREAADRVAVETDADEAVQRTLAQFRIHAALHDAEQRVRIAEFVERAARALRPAQRQLHRRARLFRRRRHVVDEIGRALVEDHRDVRVEHVLDAHRLLGTEEHLGTVDR